MKKKLLIFVIIMFVSFLLSGMIFFASGFFDFKAGYVTGENAKSLLQDLNNLPFIVVNETSKINQINQTEKFILDDQLDSININSISSNLIIDLTNSSEFTFNLEGYGTNEKLVVDIQDKVLNAHLNYSKNFNPLNDLTLYIQIPEQYKKEILISTISANIDVSNIYTNNLIINSTSGKIKVTDSTLNKAKSISGKILLENFQIKNDLFLETVSGNVLINTNSKDFGLIFTTVSGNSNIDEQKGSPQVSVKTISGNLNLN